LTDLKPMKAAFLGSFRQVVTVMQQLIGGIRVIIESR
jgi:hypothetical protein